MPLKSLTDRFDAATHQQLAKQVEKDVEDFPSDDSNISLVLQLSRVGNKKVRTFFLRTRTHIPVGGTLLGVPCLAVYLAIQSESNKDKLIPPIPFPAKLVIESVFHPFLTQPTRTQNGLQVYDTTTGACNGVPNLRTVLLMG